MISTSKRVEIRQEGLYFELPEFGGRVHILRRSHFALLQMHLSYLAY